MRSPFIWWCKNTFKKLKLAIKRDPMAVLCVIAIPLAVAAMLLLSASGGLLNRFF